MSGLEFWIWFLVYPALFVATVFLIAAWRDHDDDLSAIGTHRWPLDEDDES